MSLQITYNTDTCYRCYRQPDELRWFGNEFNSMLIMPRQFCRQCVVADSGNWEEGSVSEGCCHCHNLTEELRWFSPEILGLDSLPSGIDYFCIECIEDAGGNWDDNTVIYSDEEGEDDTWDTVATTNPYLGIDVSHPEEVNRILHNLMSWKPYDFTIYTTDTYNEWTYKYGLKCIGE